MGMAGTLSYEVHGCSGAAGVDVYNEIMRIGKPYGIVKLGTNAYMSNHTENGFPQAGLHFACARGEDENYQAYLSMIAKRFTTGNEDRESNMLNMRLIPRGTLSDDIKDYYRNPYELGWGHMVKFDHDFIGREALESIAAGNPRQMVKLVLNHEDMMKGFASFFEKEAEPYPDMPFPQEVSSMGVFLNNYFNYKVLKNGKMVGIAMWRTYTLYYRETISLCCIDPELADIGTDVTILYGDVGQRTIEIRAKVDRFPYLDLPNNMHLDVGQVPRFEKK